MKLLRFSIFRVSERVRNPRVPSCDTRIQTESACL